MFSDDSQYPYLVTDSWRNKKPQFTDSQDLFTTQLSNLKDYIIEAADLNNELDLPSWRLISIGPENFVHPDWPIPVDLSYSDPDLKTAGFGRFPLGDLNWVPAEKEQWLAQRTAEYDSIDYALNNGRLVTAVKEHHNSTVQFQLRQNYPNPFNPSTTISYLLSAAGDVSLKVFDVLGREVATLVKEKKQAGTHCVNFDGSSLASGVYFYRLRVNDQSTAKKMMFMK